MDSHSSSGSCKVQGQRHVMAGLYPGWASTMTLLPPREAALGPYLPRPDGAVPRKGWSAWGWVLPTPAAGSPDLDRLSYPYHCISPYHLSVGLLCFCGLTLSFKPVSLWAFLLHCRLRIFAAAWIMLKFYREKSNLTGSWERGAPQRA